MANKRIPKRRKKRKQKVNHSTPHAPLCALGEVLTEKAFFEEIHQTVEIRQKTLAYRPTDKLVFVTLGIIAGAETISAINTALRPHRPLLLAFGYQKCADQSVIQQTLNAATSQTVSQLQQAVDGIWEHHHLTPSPVSPLTESTAITIDIDLSALPVSKRAEGATKGYVPKRKNVYTRQLGRVLIPDTQEIVTQSLYAGNTPSAAVFKEMVAKMEVTLKLDTKAKRQQIQLRLDAGFGTDANINFALWRSYSILVKVYSWKRANALAKSVEQWVAVPSSADNTPREAGWVKSPHRYGSKTVQVAVRTPNNKQGYTYSVLVTTDTKATLADIVTHYDKRSGVPESTFCQDYQGLSMRKRRKAGFEAQHVLLLLSQLAHNLLIWCKRWLADAVAASGGRTEKETAPQQRPSMTQTMATIESRGIKRLLREVLWLCGKVRFKNGRVVCIIVNPLYPLSDRITTAFQAFLKPYKIRVLLDET
jgi:hypothetical protein